MSQTMKIRKGDVVHVLTGKDRGKQGRVIDARPKDDKVVVENLNLVKRHQRPRLIQNSSRMGGPQMDLGGIVEKPAPLPNAKQLDQAIEELTTIAGQRAQVRRARKSVAQFKIREGMPIGAKVTLRGARMYEFLDRLISIALPRIRDFRGLNPDSFDGRGNYSMGVREQIIFPEINYDDIQQVRGLDVTLTTTAETDEQARALLRGLGMPFAAESRGEQ